MRLEKGTLKEKTDKTLLERTTFRFVLSPASEQNESVQEEVSQCIWYDMLTVLGNRNDYIPASRKEVWIRCLPDSPASNYPGTLPYNRSPGPSKGLNLDQSRVPQSNGTTNTFIAHPTAAASTTTSQQVRNLCEAINSLQKPLEFFCVGYLMDPLSRKQGIYSLDTLQNHSQQQWTSFSLQHVLSKQHEITRKLTQLDKLQIANKPSSDVLQLYSTPWLDDDWGSSGCFSSTALEPHRLLSTSIPLYTAPFHHRKGPLLYRANRHQGSFGTKHYSRWASYSSNFGTANPSKNYSQQAI